MVNMDDLAPENEGSGDPKFEGCGAIGSLRGIFLAQFHPDLGALIRCQWPKGFLSKEHFDSMSRFVIPKVQEQTITVNSLGYKISGYPTYLKAKKYPRNYLLFNLCVVCYPWSRTVQFEPLVKKLSQFFVNLELESELLSRHTLSGASEPWDLETTNQIERMIEQVFVDINSIGRTILVCGENSLPLSVISLGDDPDPVGEHQVPIPIVYTYMFDPNQWDLTTAQIIPYIDGFNHIARIAALAEVNPNLVRACVQNLLYHGVVAMVPIFQYCNVYSITSEFAELRDDADFRKEVITSFKRQENGPDPSFRDLFLFISAFTYGTTVRDICMRYKPWDIGFDERRLVQYLVLRGVLRRVHKYPIYSGAPLGNLGSSESTGGLIGGMATGEASLMAVNTADSTYTTAGRSDGANGVADGPNSNGNTTNRSQQAGHPIMPSPLYLLFSGRHNTDEICVRAGMSAAQLDARIDADPNILIIWK